VAKAQRFTSLPSSLASLTYFVPDCYCHHTRAKEHNRRCSLLLRDLRCRASAPTLLEEIEFCYTPVHGSWLNMAEIEISVLVRQCLGKRRLPDVQTLRREEARAWYEARNHQQASVNWRFTTAEARTKLRGLYPSVEP
jgi:DDE superfamily endonuclease